MTTPARRSRPARGLFAVMAEDQQHAPHARGEVEEAFAHFWKVGCVDEDWGAWVDLFVPDVLYHDHFWGPLHGREEVALWIAAVMKGVPEIYTILDWYTIDGETVVFHCENRRDNPHDEGPDYWDFAGLSVIRYAGDGLWASEEDFWDLPGARSTSAAYALSLIHIWEGAQMGRVEGKVAFVTGAARGQGRAHAVRLAQEGANIIAIDRCEDLDTVVYPLATEDDLAETVRLVEETGASILATKLDVRDLDGLSKVVTDGVAQFGHLDVVVANAGICTCLLYTSRCV